MLRNIFIAGFGLLFLLTITNPAEPHLANRQAGQQMAKTEPVATALETKQVSDQVAPSTAGAAQLVVAKSYWTVTSSPVAAVPVDKINTALALYQDMGMSKQGAAYLVGNFVGESHLITCGEGGAG